VGEVNLKDCGFCQIIAGTKTADFIHRDEDVVVFRDMHPKAPIHLLVVPVKHIRSVNDILPEDEGIVTAMIMRARAVAKNLSVDVSGYRLLFNVERGAGQVIFHIHLHLMAGW
jgi:histidine triad (HIT) family protein